jgi:hypothetical protein
MSIEKDAAHPVRQDRRMAMFRSGEGSPVACSFALSEKSYSISICNGRI